MKIVEFFQTVFLMCLVVLALPFLLILKLFEKPVDKSYQEVESVLKEMKANNQEHNDWDYFLNVPIADKNLDGIRKRVEVIWDYDEFMYETENEGWLLNEKGLSELKEIINEFERYNT